MKIEPESRNVLAFQNQDLMFISQMIEQFYIALKFVQGSLLYESLINSD